MGYRTIFKEGIMMETITVCPLCGGENIDTDQHLCLDCREYVEFEIIKEEGDR